MNPIAKQNLVNYFWEKYMQYPFPKLSVDNDSHAYFHLIDTELSGIINTYDVRGKIPENYKLIAQNLMTKLQELLNSNEVDDYTKKYFLILTTATKVIIDEVVDLAKAIQYDVVTITDLDLDNTTSKSNPTIGDTATIIEVYDKDPLNIGIELECNDDKGKLLWLNSFALDSIKFIPKY